MAFRALRSVCRKDGSQIYKGAVVDWDDPAVAHHPNAFTEVADESAEEANPSFEFEIRKVAAWSEPEADRAPEEPTEELYTEEEEAPRHLEL